MLVARGACSFAEKAATVGAANASLLIVYNNASGAGLSIFYLMLTPLRAALFRLLRLILAAQALATG